MKQNSSMKFPISIPALRVDQPMGVFYVPVLPARLLMDVCFTDRLSKAGRNRIRTEGSDRDRRLRVLVDFKICRDTGMKSDHRIMKEILALQRQAVDGLCSASGKKTRAQCDIGRRRPGGWAELWAVSSIVAALFSHGLGILTALVGG